MKFSGNQSNCRICILIGECWNDVEFVELPGKAGMSGMSVEHTDGFLEDLLAFYA